MAQREAQGPVTPSILDRLIDFDPKRSSEAPLTRAQSVRQLKSGLRRDLEWLLNSRRVAVEPDESLRELNRSLYVYGLPDFSSFNVASPKDQARLLKCLQSALKIFEPRLASVQVVPIETSGVNTRELRFRVEGLLIMDPASEHVSFDTVIELRTGVCQVKGEADAG